METNRKRVLIIGATSAIAYEVAKRFAADGAWLYLVGRHPDKLASVAQDLVVRGADRVETFLLDLTELDRHHELVAKVTESFRGLDAVLVAHGTLPNQSACEQSVAETMTAFATNCLSVISVVTLFTNYFEQQSYGVLAVITSVAGDRGRRNNYVYGAAKGAVDLFLQGVRSRLSKAGVSVVTIKPGLVDTPMTAALPKHLLFAPAQTVGEGIYYAMIKGRNVVYLPWFWRWIMAIIKTIPEALFKKINL
jgi:decaprenylphospho-beta-D-erythro-pentofuranosid-2-ulose 2-reductase